MLFIEIRYPARLSPYLENFTQKKQYLWNFSCNYCGDLSKGKKKKRGYIYQAGSHLNFKCHHCGISITFENFLRDNFPDIHKEYILEKYKETKSTHTIKQDTKNIKKAVNTTKIDNSGLIVDSILSPLRKCSDLKNTHPATKWCDKRYIPSNKRNLLYYTPKFKKYVNTIKPNEFKSLDNDHPRIVIPYINEKGKVIALAGRAMKNQQPKYYMIKLEDDAERIFGLERVNLEQPIFVVEGAIDSLFLPNSIAISGASYNTPFLNDNKDKIIIIPDKEPRNKEVVKLLEKTIHNGFTISLLPEELGEKDINDMIVNGKNTKDILTLIYKYKCSGLKATLNFNQWKKCYT